uniref:Photosystem I assembly protein Ycf4 n=1 Tax=Neocystis brevis TaxID=1065496 RepID=A0A097KMQ8_9CHLO|nr:hypothetical chloroplast RF4 [Neocystis brevis]AIT94455.1 hypothetical chloroplast RF4 [Neocystis brevis]
MTDSYETPESDLIRRYIVIGSRRLSNYWWALVIFLGGLGFLLTGISSYLGEDNTVVQWLNLLPFIQSKNIIFFPQGLVMCFYGILGLIFSIYLGLTLFWSVGGGFNEFNKKEGIIRIFRWGFPGKNRRIDLSYPINEVEAIRVELKEGLNPKRTIYMRIKGKRDIPLTRIGQPLTLEEIEKQAAELAKFLQVSLEAN